MTALDRLRNAPACAEHQCDGIRVARLRAFGAGAFLTCDPCLLLLLAAIVPEEPTVAMIEDVTRANGEPVRPSIIRAVLRVLRGEATRAA